MLTLQPAGALRDGYHRNVGARFLLQLFFIIALSLPISAAAIELAEIGRLAKGGASQLALSLLTQHQPAYAEDATHWHRWERVRVRIMEERGLWQELATHISSYPTGLPDEFRHWSELRHANALINAGLHAEARQLLRRLVWQPVAGELVTGKRLAALRHLVMQSYLEQGHIKDAYAAMLRFQQDYDEQDEAALLLRAKVLLAAGHAGESLALLGRVAAGGVVEPLKALATLRSGGDAEALLKLARDSAAVEDLHLRWLWLGVMAEAAQKLSNSANLIIALERMLPLHETLVIPDSERRLFEFGPDELWQGYLAYAERVGNREQLLQGDDAAWHAAAEQTEMLYPIRKRSLYVMLSLHGVAAAKREQANQVLLTLFEQMESGELLLRRLYLDSSRYERRDTIPQGVAYRLVDDAIRNAELSLASELLQHLPEPPDDTARFAWQLRRAKVFLLAGDYDEADKLLTTLMPGVDAVSEEQRDQVVQLLFDFQAVSQHERAFRLLAAMYKAVPAFELRRELLFWMADSQKAQLKHTEAARFYLQSATLGDNNSMDPWAQTARYQAAKSLSEAGLNADATFIYKQLLRITESPERRSVLRHELQQLRLQGERG